MIKFNTFIMNYTVWKNPQDMEKSLSDIDKFNKITTLQITGNFEVIMFPASLHSLYWSDCDLVYLPPLPKTIRTFYCYNTKLEILDDLPDSIINLFCYNTKLMFITQFPKKLTALNLMNNQLTQLPELPNTIHRLEIQGNQITTLPESITSCKQLGIYTTTGNPINYTPDQLMFLYRFFAPGDYFNNGENVQAESTMQNWRQSVDNLLTDYVSDDFYAEVNGHFDNETINEWIKNQYDETLGYTPNCVAYRETYDEEEIYDEKSFKDVWIRVWNRIFGSSPEIKIELLKRYEEEMDVAQHHCETGYQVRVVNTLVGFFDDINIGPEESEVFGGIIHGIYNKILKSGLDSKSKEFQDKWRQEIVFAFAEKNIDKSKLSEWIAPLMEEKY